MTADIQQSNWTAAQHTWAHLVHALGGQLCASLDLLSDPATTAGWRAAADSYRLLGQLPQEALCVENLGHWLSLIPGDRFAGLKSTLQSRQVQCLLISCHLSLTASP